MDEPQLDTQTDEIDASTDKRDFNEVLSSAFENEREKLLNVDDVTMGDEPSTSTGVTSEESPETIEPIEEQQVESAAEHAGQVADTSEDISMSEDQTEKAVEQVIFEKPIGELDETVHSEIETDNLEFTEHSINISQLNVEHNDDSNDAFNALKESETDALQTPKEEVDEPKVDDLEPSNDTQEDEVIVAELESPKPISGDALTIEPMETEHVEPEDKTTSELTAVAETTADESHEIGTAELAELDDNESIEAVESEFVDKPDSEDAEEIVDGKKMFLNPRFKA